MLLSELDILRNISSLSEEEIEHLVIIVGQDNEVVM